MKIFILVSLLFLSFAASSSPRCGKDAHPKNSLTKTQLEKATTLKVYKTKKEAMKGIEEGHLIDLKNSSPSLRDDKDFLLFAMNKYPTNNQVAAWASNCHDVPVIDLQLFKLASKRLKNDSVFKNSAMKTKYGNAFLGSELKYK